MKMSLEEEVLEANAAFYLAFRTRDVERMENLWAEEHQVVCIHPGWVAISGRTDVLASWFEILCQPSAPDIRCKDAQAYVIGDAAYVICTEVIEDSLLAATNILVRESGGWRFVHHQAGPLALRVGSKEKASDPVIH